MKDCFDLEALDHALERTPFHGKLHFFSSIHSTNTHALKQAEAGAPHGSVYFAEEQTAGRGRGAHHWSSPPGSGLYVSILLRPQIPPAEVLWLSLAAGLAVREAVRQVTSLECDLRWPNDLLFGRRKFCGILTELNAEVTRIRHAVVGIGMNVQQEQFPPDLGDIATSLRIETGRSWPRQELLIALLQSLHREISGLSRESAPAIVRRLEAASSWVRGKHVRVEEGEGYWGVTEGLDPRGFLLVRTTEGVRTVYSGGVREA
ncbi:MAG: biotin--[acetyl-CoA-carboxylase] ligase [Acidobacterium ailaaui]|jgi:BirA family biotin operon repressor/biotin-[acetyl-CoA-carboxylase] ligase|nr:biotin--[acetyl-CoA-carboxylase] ligase [Pseudacidobacterium ailaaui]